MEISYIKKIIEALLFVSDKPLLNREIKAVIKDELPENVKIEDVMKEIQQEYVQLNRAFELKFVADGWTFATKPEYSNWIKKLLKEKTILKLSPSAMEVLAIIAYKQPITRAEIDAIRGVDPGGVIDTLTDRKFIKIVGRKETLGRPLLYGTTQEFLRHFGLSHLSELPIIEEAKDILPNKQENIPELPFDNKDNIDGSNVVNETDNNVGQQNNNVNKEVVLSNGIKDNSVDVVTENKSNEQNDNKDNIDGSSIVNETDNNVEQQNNNVNKEVVLSNGIKDNSIDVVTENKSNEQNNTEN